MANIICDKTDDAVQAFVLYKDMTIPGILERFYKKMQDRLGLMMTKADVTDIRDAGNHMVVSCKNTLLGMDFDLDVDTGGAAHGRRAHDRQGRGGGIRLPSGPRLPGYLQLYDGFADSDYICFPCETRRAGVYAAGLRAISPRPWTPVEEDRPRCRASKPSSVWKPLPTVWPCIPAPATIPTRCSTSCAAPSAGAAPRRMSLRRPGRRRKGYAQTQPGPLPSLRYLLRRLPRARDLLCQLQHRPDRFHDPRRSWCPRTSRRKAPASSSWPAKTTPTPPWIWPVCRQQGLEPVLPHHPRALPRLRQRHLGV